MYGLAQGAASSGEEFEYNTMYMYRIDTAPTWSAPDGTIAVQTSVSIPKSYFLLAEEVNGLSVSENTIFSIAPTGTVFCIQDGNVTSSNIYSFDNPPTPFFIGPNTQVYQKTASRTLTPVDAWVRGNGSWHSLNG